MTECENTECYVMREYTKVKTEPTCRSIMSVNVNLLIVVAAVLLTALFLLPSVVIFDRLPWTTESAVGYEDSRLSQRAASTELQRRMKSFLMRNSASDTPVESDFLITSHASTTQSQG